jgi:putative oxidoreductase
MLALIAGFAARLLAITLILIMLGAIITAHGEFGFFMNWFGTQGGEGYEYHLLVIGLALVIALNGAGAYSIDAYIQSKVEHRRDIANLLFS